MILGPIMLLCLLLVVYVCCGDEMLSYGPLTVSGDNVLGHTGSGGVVAGQCLFHPAVLCRVRVLWDPVVNAGAHMLLADRAAAPPTSLHKRACSYLDGSLVVLY